MDPDDLQELVVADFASDPVVLDLLVFRPVDRSVAVGVVAGRNARERGLRGGDVTSKASATRFRRRRRRR